MARWFVSTPRSGGVRAAGREVISHDDTPTFNSKATRSRMVRSVGGWLWWLVEEGRGPRGVEMGLLTLNSLSVKKVGLGQTIVVILRTGYDKEPQGVTDKVVRVYTHGRVACVPPLPSPQTSNVKKIKKWWCRKRL